MNRTKLEIMGTVGVSMALGAGLYHLYSNYSNNRQNCNKENSIVTKEEAITEFESPNGYESHLLKQGSSFIQKKDIIALVGDIGGTNCRFMLVNCTKDELIDTKYYGTNDFDGLEQAIRTYLKTFSDKEEYSPKIGSICIAAPIKDNCIERMANARWGRNDGDEIAHNLGFNKIKLLNDFEAIGYSLISLTPDDLVPLTGQNSVFKKNEMMCAVGPGTGLGVVLLNSIEVNGQLNYKVMPSEGGHVGLACKTQEDFDMQKYIQNSENPEHKEDVFLRTEQLSCGKAIPLIYKFYRDNSDLTESDELKKLGDNIEGKHISEAAIKQNDPLSLKTMEKFIANLGLACNHYAFATIPKGGIILVGDVINHMTEILLKDAGDWEKNIFLKNFYSSDKNLQVIESTPVFLCTKVGLGKQGAKQWAYDYSKNIMD